MLPAHVRPPCIVACSNPLGFPPPHSPARGGHPPIMLPHRPRKDGGTPRLSPALHVPHPRPHALDRHPRPRTASSTHAPPHDGPAPTSSPPALPRPAHLLHPRVAHFQPPAPPRSPLHPKSSSRTPYLPLPGQTCRTTSQAARAELNMSAKNPFECLVGEELNTAALVVDYVAFHSNGPRIRALTNPVVRTSAGKLQFPAQGSRHGLCSLIGQIVSGTTLREGTPCSSRSVLALRSPSRWTWVATLEPRHLIGIRTTTSRTCPSGRPEAWQGAADDVAQCFPIEVC